MFNVYGVAEAYFEPRRKLDPLIYRLRKRRYDMGWSAEKLSQKMGYSKKTLQEWENGHATPSFPALQVWCQSLGGELKFEVNDAR